MHDKDRIVRKLARNGIKVRAALAKICNYLGCGLDDVVEIFSSTEEGGDR